MIAPAARTRWLSTWPCVLMLAGALLVLGGCGSSSPDTAMPADPPTPSDEEGPDPENVVSTTGTVTFVEMEGGFWAIITPDSTRYDPGSSLPDSLRTEGLEIRFRGEENAGQPSIRMWGTPIDLLEAMPIEDAQEDTE